MSTQNLSQMGSARVSVGVFNGMSCICKEGASDVEINFYQFAASNLEVVNVPKLLDISTQNLCIEYIPNRVTLDELYKNPSTFNQLAQLHHAQYVPPFLLKRHQWTVSDTKVAFDVLQLPKVTQDSILAIQALSFVLFEYSGLISGDTNAGNWGTRTNGELVLFDWERFGFGSPAIDLAPLVNGLGTATDYEYVIEKYMQQSAIEPQINLARHLVIAKCWIIIEVTNILISRNKREASKYIRWYREHVPAWISSIERYV